MYLCQGNYPTKYANEGELNELRAEKIVAQNTRNVIIQANTDTNQ